MAATFKLPKKDYSEVIVLNTPDTGALSANTDVVLSKGYLSLLDEAGNATKFRFTDILNVKLDAYSAGTAHKLSVALASISLAANKEYKIQITLLNRQDFFLYGKETNPLVALRTYTWTSGSSTPTAADVVSNLVTVINADVNPGVTASINGTTSTLDLLADSADAGAITAVFSDSAATYADATAYVAPVGTISEVELQAPGKSVAGKTYNRYVIKYRKLVKHNAVSGLSVFRNSFAVLYSHVTTNFDAAIGAVIAGTITSRTDTVAHAVSDIAAELKKYLEVTA